MAFVLLIGAAMILCMLTSCGGGTKIIRGTQIEGAPLGPAKSIDMANSVRPNKAMDAYDQGDFDTARRLLEEEASTSPAEWWVHYYLGLLSSRDGLYHRAMNCYQAALTFAPDDQLLRYRIYLALAECWERLNEPSMAKLNYITASQLNPESDEARAALERLGSITISNQ